MWVCFSVSPVSDGGGFVFNLDDNGGDAVENVCKAVCGAFGGRDVENINRNERTRPARFFGERVCRIGKVYTFAETILATMKTPKQVIEAAKGLGTKVVFEHKLKGYDVYSVFTQSDTEPITPTGLPTLILFKDGKAKTVCGVEALDWL